MMPVLRHGSGYPRGAGYVLTVLVLVVGMLIGVLATAPVHAITAEEMLDDPGLEARARTLSRELRCLVCQNQSIDDSDADLARDLRREVRRQISAGLDDDTIRQNLRQTYGDFVLLDPPVSSGTWLLWGAPGAVLVLGGLVLLTNRRRHGTGPEIAQTDGPQTNATGADGPQTNGTAADGTGADGTGADELPHAALPQSPRPLLLGRPGVAKLAGACGVLGLSLTIYLFLGSADLADNPLAGRKAEIAARTAADNQQQQQLDDALAAAQQAVTANPNAVENWLILADAAIRLADYDTNIGALRQALKLTNDDPSIKAMLAESLSRAADGQVTIPARELIAEILAVEPNEPRALYIAGLAAYQDEDFARAVDIWLGLQAASPPDAPWMAVLADNIADAATKAGLDPAALPGADAAGPDAAALAAAAEMTDEDRQHMIESMVGGLASRLAQDPNDVAGWQRLARAYAVLGRADDAIAAHVAAARAAPDDVDVQITALEQMIKSGRDAAFQDDAALILGRLALHGSDGRAYLFLQGHFAALAGNVDQARQSWQDLLARLPVDSPFRETLRTQIDALGD